MKTPRLPEKPPTDPDRPAKRGSGKRKGLLTAAHNNEGQEGAPHGDQQCENEEDKSHGILTAAHNNEKRP